MINPAVTALTHASKIVASAGFGVMPSQESATKARDAVQYVDPAWRRQVTTVISALEMGLMPKPDLCGEAFAHLDTARKAHLAQPVIH